jgi:hypothetical protein
MSVIFNTRVEALEKFANKGEPSSISAEHIIERDYWELTKLEGYGHFMNQFKDLFDFGGIVAGGFPRRMLKHQSFTKALDECKVQTQGAKQTDIDFYFLDIKDFDKADQWCEKKSSSSWGKEVKRNEKSYYFRKFVGKSYFVNGYCVNLVKGKDLQEYKNIIAEFDFINCSIAFNKELFLSDKRIPELEKNNLLGLSYEYIKDVTERKDHGQRHKVISRLDRYLNMPEYKNGVDNVFVFRLLVSMNKEGVIDYSNEYITLSLLSKIKKDDLILFGHINSYIDRAIEFIYKDEDSFKKLVEIEKKDHTSRTNEDRTLVSNFYSILYGYGAKPVSNVEFF